MQVELLPENLLAWELYWKSQLDGVGSLLQDLTELKLSPMEAEDLAIKLETLGFIVQEERARRSKEETEALEAKFRR